MHGRSKQIAAYCRVSTLEQKKNGLGMDIQVRDVIAFAESQDLSITRFYRDEAQSGAAENRKQLNRLVKDCKRGLIGLIIIPSLDRLSRDVRIAENLFWTFDQVGIRVLIADMPYYNSSNRRDVLIRQIREAIAEDNRKEIIERLWKSRRERVRRGKPPGGTAPYGYRRVSKRLVPEPEEAAVVRIIFELSARGYSSNEIAQALSDRGHSLRNSKPWVGRQVRATLGRRRLYEAGSIRYGDIVATDRNLVLVEVQETPGCVNESGGLA